MPVIASNRLGLETDSQSSITFYGSSFICDHTGRKISEADAASEKVITARFDLDAVKAFRASWSVFKDRRPDMYKMISDKDCGI